MRKQAIAALMTSNLLNFRVLPSPPPQPLKANVIF